jgi:hypothetical protein
MNFSYLTQVILWRGRLNRRRSEATLTSSVISATNFVLRTPVLVGDKDGGQTPSHFCEMLMLKRSFRRLAWYQSSVSYIASVDHGGPPLLPFLNPC